MFCTILVSHFLHTTHKLSFAAVLLRHHYQLAEMFVIFTKENQRSILFILIITWEYSLTDNPNWPARVSYHPSQCKTLSISCSPSAPHIPAYPGTGVMLGTSVVFCCLMMATTCGLETINKGNRDTLSLFVPSHGVGREQLLADVALIILLKVMLCHIQGRVDDLQKDLVGYSILWMHMCTNACSLPPTPQTCSTCLITFLSSYHRLSQTL